MALFSFLLPTRKRTESLYRFLRSVVETTRRLDDIEVTLCVDTDDVESQNVSFDAVAIKTVIVPPGATLGTLLRNCFDASTGRFVIFMNDDVVLQTRDWDRGIYAAFTSFGDDIGLVYVNDLLFREKLSIFPVLSRQACLQIGVCPAEYRRYRIDNHIFDTYNLLASLGYRRIIYLPDVVFEHLNHQNTLQVEAEKFVSEDGKVYVPNPEILKIDGPLYDSLFEKRKEDALKLALLIEQLGCEEKRKNCVQALDNVFDITYRDNDFVQLMPLSTIVDSVQENSPTSKPLPEEHEWKAPAFVIEMQELESICARSPLSQRAMVTEIARHLDHYRQEQDKSKVEWLENLIARMKNVDLRSSASVPILIESYEGYNLVHYLNQILIVPISLGPLNLMKSRDRQRPEIRCARSLEAAKSIINELIREEAGSYPQEPVLLETYRDYNLVQFRAKIYAVPLSPGPIDLTNERARSNSQILAAKSVEQAKLIVDQGQTPAPRNAGNVLIDALIANTQLHNYLCEKEAKLNDLYHLLLSEYRAKIDELRQALKEQQIANSEVLAEKESTIEHLHQLLTERERIATEMLATHERILSQKEAENFDLQAEIRFLKAELEKTQIALELDRLR